MNEKYKQDQEEKILELQYQHLLNYINIILVTAVSILLTLWLSNDITINSMQYKIAITIGVIYLCIVFMVLLYSKLKEIEQKIQYPEKRDGSQSDE